MGRYEEWFTGLPWNDGNDPHFNKDGNSLSHWFGDKRHFRPWYDDDSDYNTNAKSYYDFIAYRTRQLDYIIQAINKLLDRNLQVEDTNTIDLEKIGEWLNKDDTETLRAFVKISNQTLNATKALDDGIYTKDLMPDINQLRADLERVRADLQGKIDNLQNQINQVRADMEAMRHDLQGKIDNLQGQINTINNRLGDLENSLNQLRQTVQNNYSTLQNQIDALREQIKQILSSISTNGKVEVPRNISLANNHYLINKVDLGNITDQTRVAITGHLGSTRLTTSYYVSELKSDASHMFIGNTVDSLPSMQFSEVFTKIVDGNKLWATVAHSFEIRASNHSASPNSIIELTKCYDSDGHPYYNKQSPEYADESNTNQHLLVIDKVVVYDLKEPVNINK